MKSTDDRDYKREFNHKEMMQGQRKPPVRNKIIETELGLEKNCTKCDELYPLEPDFFYRDGKNKLGEVKFTTQCKDCYKQSYRSKPIKSKQ